MWWARSEVLDVYWSSSQLVLRDGAAPVHREPVQGDDWQSALQLVLAQRPRRRWRLWLGGRLCALHAVEPIEGIRHIEEAEAAVAALLGTSAVPVDVRLALWSARAKGPWLSLSSPAGLAAQCEQLMKDSGAKLASLRPWWLHFAARLGPDAVVLDDEAVHYWRCSSPALATAGSVVAPEPQRHQLLQRLRVAGPLPGWRLCGLGPEASLRDLAIETLDKEDHAARRPSV